MKIVGCDLHTRYQQVAMLDAETGEGAGPPFHDKNVKSPTLSRQKTAR
jgi:hypothetical protein